MTRKRFVKLMMSYGYSRNESENIAREVPGKGSYDEEILPYMVQNVLPSTAGLMLETIVEWSKILAETVSTFVETLPEIAQKIAEAISAPVCCNSYNTSNDKAKETNKEV